MDELDELQEDMMRLKKAGEKLGLKVGFVELKGNSIFTRFVYKLKGFSGRK